MSIKTKLTFILAIFASMHANAHANDQQLWRYPCDVYMSSVCLRLPNAMSVSYEVPADAGIYTVRSLGKNLISAYVGSAPSLPGGTPSLTLDSVNATLVGFLGEKDGLTTVDIVIYSKQKSNVIVHLFGAYSSEQREEVAATLSGLRACQKRGKENLWCPKESAWGEAMTKWIVSASR